MPDIEFLPADLGRQLAPLGVGDPVELVEAGARTAGGVEVRRRKCGGAVEKVTAKRLVVRTRGGATYTFSRETGRCVAHFPGLYVRPGEGKARAVRVFVKRPGMVPDATIPDGTLATVTADGWEVSVVAAGLEVVVFDDEGEVQAQRFLSREQLARIAREGP